MGALNSILGIVNSAATSGAGGVGGAGGAGGTNPLAKAAPAGDDSFGKSVMGALDGLQAVQNNADGLAVKAATGDLNDVHNYTIAATEASLATEFTVAFRNRAVETFNDIMRMQI